MDKLIKKFIPAILLIASLYCMSLSAAAAGGSLHTNKNKFIRSISADIKQTVVTSGTTRNYEGSYTAIDDGRFRIDYLHPARERIIYDGKTLVWIDSEKKTAAFYDAPFSGGVNPATAAAAYPPEHPADSAVFEGRNFISLFNRADVFMAAEGDGTGFTRYWIDSDRGIILKRSVYTEQGSEVSVEIFSSHVLISGIYIPRRVDVFSRTVKSSTRYSGIIINSEMKGEIFKIVIPPDYRIERR